ncbi:hypothetical protein HCA75_14505 [Listeria seeligeri]|nr:hypothetical protein [Listeria seeligeri]
MRFALHIYSSIFFCMYQLEKASFNHLNRMRCFLRDNCKSCVAKLVGRAHLDNEANSELFVFNESTAICCALLNIQFSSIFLIAPNAQLEYA